MTKVVYCLGLLASAGAGFALGNYILKKKYEEKADAEVESVKRFYETYYQKPVEEKPVKEEKVEEKPSEPVKEKKEKKKKDKDNTVDYANLYKPSRSSKKSDPSILEEIHAENLTKDIPYVISPQDFNESPYEAQTLFYYADGVLSDDDYNYIGDVFGNIGPDALDKFGMYEEDCVYVRNDRLKIDYEILKDERRYCDISPIVPDDDND